MRVGVSRLVCVSKWLGFVVSLVFTVGRIGEYCLLGKLDDLLYYSYFATLNTQVAKLETYFDYLTPATCFACNVIELVLFIIIVSELLRLHIRRVRQRPDAAERHARKNAITAISVMGHRDDLVRGDQRGSAFPPHAGRHRVGLLHALPQYQLRGLPDHPEPDVSRNEAPRL